MDYEDRLKMLNWPTLEKRRLFVSLVECFRTVFRLNNLKFSDFFELSISNRSRANHSFKLYVKSAKCNSYKYSFFVRIIQEWHGLNYQFWQVVEGLNGVISI